MKKSVFLIFSFAVMAATIHISAQNDTASRQEPAYFSPALENVIRNYRGTVKPVLPQLENRDLIDRPTSVVPGRMHIPRNIVVDKDARRLSYINVLGDTVLRFPVCASRNRGQKHVKDDCKTPEGTFILYGLYDSTDWRYKGTGDKCYGPWFLSLLTPGFWGIGIHGTNAPYSIPGRSSHGCMRLHNENVSRLKPLVQKDTRVTVLPDRNVTAAELASQRYGDD